MKKTLLSVVAVVLFAAPALAGDTYVDGYVRRDGTYVAPHYRSEPDSNPNNNYSAQGNTNPYTGQQGTVNPYTTQNAYVAPPVYNPPVYNPPAVNNYGSSEYRFAPVVPKFR
jgi:opacity protein-like surface antigen